MRSLISVAPPLLDALSALACDENSHTLTHAQHTLDKIGAELDVTVGGTQTLDTCVLASLYNNDHIRRLLDAIGCVMNARRVSKSFFAGFDKLCASDDSVIISASKVEATKRKAQLARTVIEAAIADVRTDADGARCLTPVANDHESLSASAGGTANSRTNKRI